LRLVLVSRLPAGRSVERGGAVLSPSLLNLS